MITHNFNTLDLLTSPVWIVSPFEEQLIYANSAARLLMQDLTFSQLRTGPYSVSSQKELPKYLSDLQNQHDIIEILTVQRKEEETALSCRLVLRKLTEAEPVIIFEGIEAPATLGLKASRSANYQRKKQGFYARFFLTNSAPMLLIDPSRDGQIVDANLAIAQDYSLLLIDTDRFKHINDLYGHSKGDEVLCALARTLESCARKGDLVFRWGGEEFVLLLPRTPLDTALSLAETIRVSVAKVSISSLPRFTVSIGVAHHEGNESIDELFKRVDDALYRAKNDGRNRVLAA
ncbi:TPA: GGDEF domain-containing protein [Escherichia coli]|nr:GGDEF domain-containing protein [Escherichia coli]